MGGLNPVSCTGFFLLSKFLGDLGMHRARIPRPNKQSVGASCSVSLLSLTGREIQRVILRTTLSNFESSNAIAQLCATDQRPTPFEPE